MNISRIAPAFAAWMMAEHASPALVAEGQRIISHDHRARTLGLTTDQQRDLVEYLKSL